VDDKPEGFDGDTDALLAAKSLAKAQLQASCHLLVRPPRLFRAFRASRQAHSALWGPPYSANNRAPRTERSCGPRAGGRAVPAVRVPGAVNAPEGRGLDRHCGQGSPGCQRSCAGAPGACAAPALLFPASALPACLPVHALQAAYSFLDVAFSPAMLSWPAHGSVCNPLLSPPDSVFQYVFEVAMSWPHQQVTGGAQYSRVAWPRAQFAVAGPIGDSWGAAARDALKELSAAHPGRVWSGAGLFITGAAKDRLVLAADFCLCPSRFEPCGLVDIEFGWQVRPASFCGVYWFATMFAVDNRVVCPTKVSSRCFIHK